MDYAPGYLAWPIQQNHPTLDAYLSKETYADGYYMNKPKFMVSMLKEWYGDNATAENNYCYDLLPKRSLKHNDPTIPTFHYMAENQIKGYLVWGMNPAHSEPNTKYCREVLGKLDWMIVADWFATETATFWKAPGMKPEEIQTTVYMLPAALIYEKKALLPTPAAGSNGVRKPWNLQDRLRATSRSCLASSTVSRSFIVRKAASIPIRLPKSTGITVTRKVSWISRLLPTLLMATALRPENC